MRGASALARGFVCGFWFFRTGEPNANRWRCLDFTIQDVDDNYEITILIALHGLMKPSLLRG